MGNVSKKPFLKSLSISNEILSKFGICDTPDYQSITSKGSRTMGSEWPDQCKKTGLGNVTRGGRVGIFSRGHPPKLNHVVEFTDNRMTEAAVNNGTARNGTYLHLLKHFAALALQFNFNISAVYTPGDDNTITDKISRLHEPGKLLSSLLNVLVSYLLHDVNISAKFRPFFISGLPQSPALLQLDNEVMQPTSCVLNATVQ